VFSGYALAELEERARAEETGVRALLGACDLLVDGRFEKDELDASRRWIGSRNQTLHFRSARYAPDDPRFRAPQTAEVRLENGVVTMNGWPALVPAIKRSPGGKARG
jgi:anaerobic ribonucleoside-triphosphate reductase activating protein